MKILLLGGTGTLSSEVLKCSILHRYSVSILNRGKNNVNVDKDVSVYISDLRFPKTVDAVLSKETFDVIVDFYSRTKENISSLFPILSKRCTQYIFISSACVYCHNNEATEALTEKCGIQVLRVQLCAELFCQRFRVIGQKTGLGLLRLNEIIVRSCHGYPSLPDYGDYTIIQSGMQGNLKTLCVYFCYFLW
mgnify:CR=1 FL=1